MPKICPLFSSSSGNCIYIADGENAILIDAGVSAKRIKSALSDRGLDIKSVKAVFITHSHNDHIAGLTVLLKHHKIPLYASEKTFSELIKHNRFPAGSDISIENSVRVENMEITRFSTSHDAPGSCGYTVKFADGQRLAVCTDLGYVSEEVRSSIMGCRTVYIESNHDISMLSNGPYPIELKMRISSDKGHISNSACAKELPELVRQGAVRFILAHLSEQNNRPEIAKAASVGALLSEGFIENEDYIITVAAPDGNPVITI